MKELKPVIFVQGEQQFYRQNNYAQIILLKAMGSGITDPNELRRIAGLKTVAEVYRTLDKLAIRREYHEALSRQGVSLDGIVMGIKQISEGSSSEAIRLKGYQTLLRSLGLDKYEKQEDVGKSWEEVILGIGEQQKEGDNTVNGEWDDYDVKTPITPAEEQKRIAKEKEIGQQLYGS
jgi:hypothetical protein